MNGNTEKSCVLSGNQLKIIALITMTVDHVGWMILPEIPLLRVIGRIAFPIFAYMIAEGCRYTKDRPKYLVTMASLAFPCQAIYFIATGSLYQCVLVTFSLSVSLIYIIDYAAKRKTKLSSAIATLAVSAVFFVSSVLPLLMAGTGYAIDYGFFGILLPAFAYFGTSKKHSLMLFSVGLALLCMSCGGVQWFSMITILLLALYSGKRGKMKLKNLFYIYYPLHLAAIYGLAVVLR